MGSDYLSISDGGSDINEGLIGTVVRGAEYPFHANLTAFVLGIIGIALPIRTLVLMDCSWCRRV